MPSNTVNNPLKVYIDENLAPQFAHAFNIIQTHLNFNEKKPIKVLSIKEEFGEGILDEEWIPLVGKEHGIVVTCDRRIQSNRHQQALYQQHGVGIVFLHNPKHGRTFWDTFKHFVKWWDKIKTICRRNKPPFAYRQPGQNNDFVEWN
jgi:hypothetical protein